MSRPLTEPSTPLRGAVKIDEDYGNYSAPGRTRVSVIHLPPHELPGVISGMSSRRASISRLSLPGVNALLSPAPFLGSLYGQRQTPPAKSNRPSRRQTPNRRISDHLTVRRRRRSSMGVMYDSAFAGAVNKDFLRLFSRTLVKEKKQLNDEPDDQVFKALDRQHRIASTSPQGPIRDFDLSLPLPSEDEMDSPKAEVNPSQTPEKMAIREASRILPKPVVFKSYLERILESRSRKSRRVLDLTFDRESSEDAGRPEETHGTISTSKFIIENTIAGLPESSKVEGPSEADLRLADPVAFGVLQDVESSNESSRRDHVAPLSDTSIRSARSPQIGLANVTPDSYHAVHFDDVDEPDVPSWEPVPIFDNPEARQTPSPGADIENHVINDQFSENWQDIDAASLDSDSSQGGIISGHFTVDNDDIVNEDESFSESSNAVKRTRSVSPPVRRVKPLPSIASTKSRVLGSDLPKSMVKGFLAAAQHLTVANHSDGSPRKRQKIPRLDATIVELISRKSSEFLSQVMQDLGAYADHRNSDQIGLADAVLLMNRVKSRHDLLGEDNDFPELARSVFPLEHLMALENSLQSSMKDTRKVQSKSVESESGDDAYEEI